MEKQPSFERIVGGTEKQKAKAEQEAEKASYQTGEELYGEHLVEPTEEECVSIEQAVVYANTIAHDYGSTKQFDIDRIFLLKPGSISTITGRETGHGLCNSMNQSIAVERADSNALLASCVAHEMFHMNSYHSSQIVQRRAWLFNKTEHKRYRSGISMQGRHGEGDYFSLAEEAIIATLSRQFFSDVITHNSLYREEIENTEKVREWLLDYAQRLSIEPKRKDQFIAGIQDILILPESEKVCEMLHNPDKTDEYKMGFFRGYYEENLKSGNIMHERATEREKFNEVLDRILAEARNTTIDHKQLFDEFARAHFTGNYIPLAKLIESVLGRGSFREIAKELGEMNDN